LPHNEREKRRPGAACSAPCQWSSRGPPAVTLRELVQEIWRAPWRPSPCRCRSSTGTSEAGIRLAAQVTGAVLLDDQLEVAHSVVPVRILNLETNIGEDEVSNLEVQPGSVPHALAHRSRRDHSCDAGGTPPRTRSPSARRPGRCASRDPPDAHFDLRIAHHMVQRRAVPELRGLDPAAVYRWPSSRSGSRRR